MSRPFSYNDENFTVIGNVLFCHIKVVKDVLHDNELIEIPPAIANRLLYASSPATTTSIDVNVPRLRNFILYVIKKDSNYYFSTTIDITTNANYIICYYNLKDI